MILSILSSDSNIARPKVLSHALLMDEKAVKEALGRRIAEARAFKKLGQTDFGNLIGVSRGAPAQWEIGRTAPKTANLIQVAIETGYAFEWLATERGPKFPIQAQESNESAKSVRRVPVISWVSAGQLADAGSQIPIEDAPVMSMSNLGRGEFFALRVEGDSMDRWSPEGSIIIVNRADRQLVSGKAYVFSLRGETTYKRWNAEPAYLNPHSWNANHQPRFIRKKKDYEVVGRVKRTILDL